MPLERNTTPNANDSGTVVRVVGTVPVSGTVGGSPAGTGAVTRVVVSTSSVTLKAANAARLGLSVQNNSSTSILYVKGGATPVLTAGSESWTYPIQPGGYYELPFGYTGIVDGIWDIADASGMAMVTEFTA